MLRAFISAFKTKSSRHVSRLTVKVFRGILNTKTLIFKNTYILFDAEGE